MKKTPGTPIIPWLVISLPNVQQFLYNLRKRCTLTTVSILTRGVSRPKISFVLSHTVLMRRYLLPVERNEVCGNDLEEVYSIITTLLVHHRQNERDWRILTLEHVVGCILNQPDKLRGRIALTNFSMSLNSLQRILQT